jgi:hypothetical protein
MDPGECASDYTFFLMTDANPASTRQSKTASYSGVIASLMNIALWRERLNGVSAVVLELQVFASHLEYSLFRRTGELERRTKNFNKSAALNLFTSNRVLGS